MYEIIENDKSKNREEIGNGEGVTQRGNKMGKKERQNRNRTSMPLI